MNKFVLELDADLKARNIYSGLINSNFRLLGSVRMDGFCLILRMGLSIICQEEGDGGFSRKAIWSKRTRLLGHTVWDVRIPVKSDLSLLLFNRVVLISTYQSSRYTLPPGPKPEKTRLTI